MFSKEIKIESDSITIDGLSRFQGKTVEVLVFPLPNSKEKSERYHNLVKLANEIDVDSNSPSNYYYEN